LLALAKHGNLPFFEVSMIVVTGANGFIGSAMIWELNRRGFADIIAVDIVGPEQRPELLKPLKYRQFVSHKRFIESLASPNESKSLAHNLSAIYHIGACSATTERNWDYLVEVNIEYTQKIFEWCANYEVPLVFSSSGATYGDGALGFDDARNTRELRPLNLYGKSKAEVDIWALEQKKTPPHWYALRYFNVFGPNEYFKGEMASLVYKAYLQIQETGRLKLFKSYNPKYGDGLQMRDFVYIKDITRWMWELIENGLENKWMESGIYNQGFGQARTWLDLAKAIFSSLDRPMNIEWIEMPDSLKNQYQYFTEAKMDRWEKAGGSAPEWNLERAVPDYVKNYMLAKSPYLNAAP
jgi:ADP-L-glycero-D-manno-heptose 6-epimerase